jgi:hypothetical protein
MEAAETRVIWPGERTISRTARSRSLKGSTFGGRLECSHPSENCHSRPLELFALGQSPACARPAAREGSCFKSFTCPIVRNDLKAICIKRPMGQPAKGQPAHRPERRTGHASQIEGIHRLSCDRSCWTGKSFSYAAVPNRGVGRNNIQGYQSASFPDPGHALFMIVLGSCARGLLRDVWQILAEKWKKCY